MLRLMRKACQLLALLLMGGILGACYGPSRLTHVLSEPVILENGNSVSREFSIATLESSKSVLLNVRAVHSEAVAGQFRINGNAVVPMELAVSELFGDGSETLYILPRKWFARNNTVVFEHLDGVKFEITSILLSFSPQVSLYELTLHKP